jgi:hypothetical protein
MEFRIDFGGEPQDVTVTTAGRADLEGFERFNEALVSDPRYRPGMTILVDHSQLDASTLSPPEVEAVGDIVARVADRLGPSLVAIVSGDRVTFGQAGISVAYAPPERIRVRVFYTLDEAVEWLRSESGAGRE